MGTNPSKWSGTSLPVENTTWAEAMQFCQAVAMRLASESEYEYAARAGTTGPLYGDVDEISWNRGNSGGHPHPVATKPPNAWGLYDMLGNVSQWTADWKSEGQSRAVGVFDWDTPPEWIFVWHRAGADAAPSLRWERVGFRCVGNYPNWT